MQSARRRRRGQASADDQGQDPGRSHRDRGAEVGLHHLRPHHPVRPRLLRQGRPHHQGGGIPGEPPQRGHPLRQGSSSAPVGLPRRPAAHAPQTGGTAGLGGDGAHLLDRGPRHRGGEPPAPQSRERPGVGDLLLRLPQAASAVPAAARLPVRLSQLLHRVEHLLHRHGHGLAPGLRPDGRAGHGQDQAHAGVDRQRLLFQHPQRPPADGRPRQRGEVHRGRPA